MLRRLAGSFLTEIAFAVTDSKANHWQTKHFELLADDVDEQHLDHMHEKLQLLKLSATVKQDDDQELQIYEDNRIFDFILLDVYSMRLLSYPRKSRH